MSFIHFLCSEVRYELDFCFLGVFFLHVNREILSVALSSRSVRGLGVLFLRFLVLGVR